MTFDVIIGNPPYHEMDGGYGASAAPLYHHFIRLAKALNPRYLSMIIPARWLCGAGKGLDAFSHEMLHDARVRRLVDYPDAAECFPGVEIKGGVCYFLWERDNPGTCEVTTMLGGEGSTTARPLLEEDVDIFIRYHDAIPILRKVLASGEESFSALVSRSAPFGIPTNFSDYSEEPFAGSVKLHMYRATGYIRRDQIPRRTEWVDAWKVYIAAAYGDGLPPYTVMGNPFLGEPGTCCSHTFLVVGPFDSRETCENVMSYMRTRFFRFLVLLRKPTQHASRTVYSFVPKQDFGHPWTDEMLYAKYVLTEGEIAFIESMVRHG